MVHNQPKPRVSIVICTYNRANLLQMTLDALPALAAREKAEILIVDNNSTDHTREITKSFALRQAGVMSVQYVFEQTQGLSAARNRGIQEAKGDIIAYLDDDAVPCLEWIRTIVDTFDHRPDVCAIGGKIRPRFESERPAWLISALELPYTIVDRGEAVHEYPINKHPFGANMAIRKSFHDTYLFPTDLGRKGTLLLSGEESWLFEQMKQERKKILYQPSMVVDHFIPDNRLTKDWIKRRYYYQGVTNGSMPKGFISKSVLLCNVACRLLYIAVDALFAHTEGKKLLIACRMQSIKGTLITMRSRVKMRLTG
ncbi:glycosyltransferase [Paenibacillus aceris]|uniref:Glycosyltransferase involved in cell wall biosynthesis n=1 Tax=Paenibacillus aceris TaxID=869555 RepID=A0ABS4HWD2_9BACL|nr:glycosyltransferase [Paenibacillus aceris]MBP1962950.1 glycosyltransferase involved in cell wall biosynthesis [Paenibacillus aceris]NHW38376.1 glycosyltransferase [Paenibacillus aceris]